MSYLPRRTGQALHYVTLPAGICDISLRYSIAFPMGPSRSSRLVFLVRVTYLRRRQCG